MKLRHQLLAATLLGLSASLGVGNSPATAQDLKAIDAGLFKSVDISGDGKVSRREIIHFADMAFISIDADGDDILTTEEFIQWDPGYLGIAQESGKMEQLAEAKKEVYRLADLNGDGSLDHEEYSVWSLYNFYKADANHDRTLSQDELIGYGPIKVMRSAVE